MWLFDLFFTGLNPVAGVTFCGPVHQLHAHTWPAAAHGTSCTPTHGRQQLMAPDGTLTNGRLQFTAPDGTPTHGRLKLIAPDGTPTHGRFCALTSHLTMYQSTLTYNKEYKFQKYIGCFYT